MSSERGSGTVLAVGVVAGLSSLLVLALLVVAVLSAGQRARTAADLAALAGAGRLVQGEGERTACAVAAQVAEDNDGSVRSCGATVVGPDPWPRLRVIVTSEVAGTPWLATAEAVAGGVPRTD
jgi:secretion/DNA translocation related TadE-like protein